MAQDPGEGIYRSMREDTDGLPLLGTSAETLGIRRDKDIVPDASGQVHRPNFAPAEANGLSCAPTIQDLPRFVMPRIWGGPNRRTVIWQIATADLGSDLIAKEDSDPRKPMRHVSIGPARSMLFDEFMNLIQSRRPNWQKVPRN